MKTSHDHSLFLLLIILILQTQTLVIRVDGVIIAQVMNEINTGGMPIKIHCVLNNGQDLGYHDLKYTEEFEWEFESPFWMDTKYTCYVLMEGDPIWYFFDAYVESRDYKRCIWFCRWRIYPHLVLLGFNENNGSWENFPFSATELEPAGYNATSFSSEAPSTSAPAPAPIGAKRLPS